MGRVRGKLATGNRAGRCNAPRQPRFLLAAGSGVPFLNNRSRLPWQVCKHKAQPLTGSDFFHARRSARYCGEQGAGKYHRDEVRNIVGSFWNNKNGLFTDSGYANGAMRRVQATDSFSTTRIGTTAILLA